MAVVNFHQAKDSVDQIRDAQTTIFYLDKLTCRWNNSWSGDEMSSKVLKNVPDYETMIFMCGMYEPEINVSLVWSYTLQSYTAHRRVFTMYICSYWDL